MRVRVVGTDLPGDTWCGEPLAVAVQRERGFEGVTPAGAARFEHELDLRLAGDGRDPDDVRGPYVFGRKGDRFFYLAWISPAGREGQGDGGDDAGGGWRIVRRAKIPPGAVPAGVWAEAAAGGGVLEVTLPLTDERGGPRCATVDAVCRWRVVPA